MLAKIWKKALFAVCIIACIFNVTSKLVNRTSLEIQLRSVQNEPTVTSTLKNDNKDNKVTNSSKVDEKNENKVNNEEVSENETIVVIN